MSFSSVGFVASPIPPGIDSVPFSVKPTLDAISSAVLPFLDPVASAIESILNLLPRIIFAGISLGYRKTDQNTTQNKDNFFHFSPSCHQRLDRVLYLLKRTRRHWVDKRKIFSSCFPAGQMRLDVGSRGIEFVGISGGKHDILLVCAKERG
jgi:hypothetical protein